MLKARTDENKAPGRKEANHEPHGLDQLAGMDGCGLDDVASAVGRAQSLAFLRCFLDGFSGRSFLKFVMRLRWSGWRFWRYRRL